MNADDVLAQAQARTGFTDIDSDSWRAGLDVILKDIAGPAVTDDGRNLVIGRAVDALANRLRVHDYVCQHLEVLTEEVKKPRFILGMPRTGTTVASYLLDQDPARRSLLKWEAVDTVPPATPDTWRTDPRCLAMKEVDNFVLDFLKASGNGVPHWEEADGPTECMFVHQQDFKGLLWDSFTPTTRYADWLLDEANVASAYEYEKVILQILQSAIPGTWSLKMPSHSINLDALLDVFPDAELVWVHRDPYKATASLCNLLMLPGTMVQGEGNVDHDLLGQNCKRQMQEHVNRPLKVRARIGDDRFFHLHYTELLRDPIGQMRAMYDWACDALTPEVESRMSQWLEENPQHKHGVSPYSLDEFGLTQRELEPVFMDYLNAFDIELEGGA